MRAYKALGPNGYQAIFYNKTWQVTGEAVYSFVKGVMNGGTIPDLASEVSLVLIPRSPHPTSMCGFRPLSLRNISIKLVSKIIMKRVKEASKTLISPC